MKAPRVQSAKHSRWSAVWRDERGFAVFELVASLAVLGVALAAAWAHSGKGTAVQAALGPIRQCQATVAAAKAEIQKEFGQFNDQGTFTGYLPGTQISENDPRVTAIRSCEATLANFNTSVQAGNRAALDDLRGQINEATQAVASCTITDPLTAGVPGETYSAPVIANIPFATGSPGAGTITATGAAVGDGTFNFTSPPRWTGNITITGEASKDAGGKTSQVMATATTPALVTPNPPGAGPRCPGASIEDNGRCVQIVRLDGTCPAGQTKKDDRCYVSCTTNVVPLQWKFPAAPAVVLEVEPKEITKGSTQKVSLRWVISNAKSATLAPDIGGPIATDPAKAVTAEKVFSVTPQNDTTWTLTAQGVSPHGSVSDSATLKVKPVSAEATTVTIPAPSADENIFEEGVTVSGVVSPVPDADHRKAQILVNGAFLSEATITNAGTFSARTALQNLVRLGSVKVVGNPSVGVTKCGSLAESIGVFVDQSEGARNLIRVVVPLAEGQASSSVTVNHGIVVNRFQVNWGGGCGPAPPQDSTISVKVATNQTTVEVGKVFCGFRFSSGSVHCSDTATISVGTSVGTKVVTQGWRADIDSCE